MMAGLYTATLSTKASSEAPRNAPLKVYRIKLFIVETSIKYTATAEKAKEKKAFNI